MSDQVAGQEPFELAAVRNREDYADALTRLIARGRRERCITVLSATEAYAVAELLGQYAQLDPADRLHQLAATMASRIYSRLGV
ncbi:MULTISPECIES: hypothetical protein [Amycolatopsis]|uniref:Uncharacterized protein n=1 Tax=Amycolatopsis bullii TaxID=941987 RepID=A0ABQ3KNP1_9PSEU|nr:hypothetical protein [Amycolatopsis bullii]GHG41682.1 hypothetical protein GCM10017567_74120 [Amycolatopsis bullii]